MVSYSLHKRVDVLLAPLGISLWCGIAGRGLAGRRRLSAGFFAVAAAVAYVLSIEPVAEALLFPLECGFPPPRLDLRSSAIRYVAVLGGGYNPRAGYPATAALDADGTFRIAEAVRLARLLPGGQAHSLRRSTGW